MKTSTRMRYIVDMRAPLAVRISDAIIEALAVGAEKVRAAGSHLISADLATNTVEISVGVSARGPAEALKAAELAFARALREAGIKDAHITEATVEIDPGVGPLRQKLLSGAEVARRLGISRQRVSQLARTKRFPAATASVGGYLVWRWGDIADWAAFHRRRTSMQRRIARSA